MSAAPILLFGVLGVIVGMIHLALLGKDVRLLVQAGGPVRAIGWRLVRLGLTGILLVWASRGGAAPLLAAAAGILLARQWVLYRLRTSAP